MLEFLNFLVLVVLVSHKPVNHDKSAQYYYLYIGKKLQLKIDTRKQCAKKSFRLIHLRFLHLERFTCEQKLFSQCTPSYLLYNISGNIVLDNWKNVGLMMWTGSNILPQYQIKTDQDWKDGRFHTVHGIFLLFLVDTFAAELLSIKKCKKPLKLNK